MTNTLARFTLLLTTWLCCVTVHAAVVTNRIHFDHQLDVEVLNGYPHDLNSLDDHVTLGFIFRNRGEARQLALGVDGDVDIQQRISLPAGETFRLFLYLPYLNNNDFHIRLTDIRSGASIKPYYLRGQGGYYGTLNDPVYTLGRLGTVAFALNVEEPWIDVGRLDTDRKMPDHWRGLSGLHFIVVEARYLREPHAWKPVLLDWLAMGGKLLIASNKSVVWEAVLPGSILTRSVTPDRVQIGLGQAIVLAPEQLGTLNDSFLEMVGISIKQSYSLDSAPANTNLLLKSLLSDTGKAPRTMLFTMLVLFAIIVGPLSWWYFIRRQQRPFRYILVVIATSTLFCVSILTTALMFEGMTPKGKVRSLRLMDLTNNRQITLAQTAMFAPMQYGTTIEAPADSTPLHFTGHEFYYQRLNYAMRTDGITQYLEGVLSVRQRQVLGMRRIATPEGELVLARDGAMLRVENLMHTALRDLYIRDGNNVYHAERLASGEGKNLQPSTGLSFQATLNYPDNLMLGEAVELVDELQAGEISLRYFFGQLEQTPKEYFLMPDMFRPMDEGEHYLMGVY